MLWWLENAYVMIYMGVFEGNLERIFRKKNIALLTCIPTI